MWVEPSRRDVIAAAGAATASAALAGGAIAREDPAGLSYRSAGELIAALAGRQVSARELVDSAIARIEALDPKINAVVVRDFERARIAAVEADAALARGERRPLLGLPMTVKEQHGVGGLPTTRGDPKFKGWMAEVDSLAVQRLKAAGAIILGKTNVPIAMRDWQSYNEVYGTTNNPWDTSRSPGGSSGGAAAALASGFVPLELGSDMGGSLRCPAHFCGVFSHKPSLDLVPQRGPAPPQLPSVPLRGDLAVYGPMARSATDLALELAVIAGPDEFAEGIGYKLVLPPPRHDQLRISGCWSSTSTRSARPPLPSPRHSTGSRSGSVKTLPLDDQSLSAYRLRGIAANHAEWIRATRVRTALRGPWFNLFRDVDVLLCPPMPTAAFRHDHSPFFGRRLDVDGNQIRYLDQMAWAGIASLNGLPATTMPIGRTEDGLPIGMQIIGGYLEDRTPIAFAGLVEREFGGFTPPPL
jgi:amidase